MALHEVLGEGFAGFQLGGGASRAKDGPAARAEQIGDAVRQRSFRSDHGQVDPLLLSKGQSGLWIARVERGGVKLPGDAGIAWSAQDAVNTGITGEPPAQGVLARARSDYQNPHLSDCK
jgi:hypothetical protein